MVPLAALLTTVPPAEAAFADTKRVLASLEAPGPYRLVGAGRLANMAWVVVVASADGASYTSRVLDEGRVSHLYRYEPKAMTLGGTLPHALVRKTDRWIANLRPRYPVRSWPLTYAATFRGFSTYAHGHPFLQPDDAGYRFVFDPNGTLLVYGANENVPEVPPTVSRLTSSAAAHRAFALLMRHYPPTGLRMGERADALGWVWNGHDPVRLAYRVSFRVVDPSRPRRRLSAGRIYLDAVTGATIAVR